MERNNQHINTPEDDFLKDLFSDFEPDEITSDQKKQIMAKVLHQWALNPEKTSNNLFNYKLWVSLGVIVLLIGAYVIDSMSLLDRWNLKGINISLPFLKDIEYSLHLLYASLKDIPSVVSLTLLGAVILLATDFSIRRYKQHYGNRPLDFRH